MRLSASQHIISEVARRNKTSIHVAGQALAILLSKGAANRGAPMNLDAGVTDPQTGQPVRITKGEVLSAMRIVTGKENFKMLARSIAPEMIEFGKTVYRNNNVLLPGDLANTINRRLRSSGRPILTPDEAVCAASYTAHLPNLDNLANSQRLSQLLQEDATARFGKREKPEKKDTTKRKKQNRKQVEKKSQQQKQQEKDSTL
jgi:hypothetical protein